MNFSNLLSSLSPSNLSPQLLDSLSNQLSKLPKEQLQMLQQQLQCSWWSLPKSLQDSLQKQFCSGKSEWELMPYKNPDGSWGFDLPKLLTINEKLIGGTDLCMDYYWEKLNGSKPQPGDQLKMLCSSNPLEDGNCELSFQGDDDLDPQSSYYLDKESGILCWLCPYLTFLFGGKPEKLYLKLSNLG